MMKRWMKRATWLAMTIALAMTATGCWGKHELTELFFVTGVALDTSVTPGEIEYALQVAKTQAASSGKSSGGSSSSEKATILFTDTEKTMAEAINSINRDASRKIFIHHNQVILFGDDLARAGLYSHIDIFMRDQESRMEVPIAIVMGKAADVLEAEMEQDKVTGAYLSRLFDSRSTISPNYTVSILDFASRLLEPSISPVAPLLKLTKTGDQTELSVEGMAIFKDDKMIGTLDNEATYGYVWAMGSIENGRMAAESDQGRAVFQIETLTSAWDVKPKDDGGVKATVTINAQILLDELAGFTDVPEDQFVEYLRDLATNEIQNRISATFEMARAMDADIYGIGVMLHKHHKAAWHAIADQWDAQFQNVEFEVQVSVQLPTTGKVIQSVEMGEKK